MHQIIYLAINISIAIFIIVISSRNLNVRGGKSILFLSTAALICYISNLIYYFSPSNFIGRIFIAVIFFGSALAITALFIFALEYTYITNWLRKYSIYLFIVMAIVTQITYWIPEKYIPIIKGNYLIDSSSLFTLLGNFNSVYLYTFLTITVGLLVNFLVAGRKKSIRSSVFYFHFGAILIGPIIALSTQGLILIGVNWHWLKPVFLISLNQCALGLIYYALQDNSISRLLSSRGKIVEKMDDGWIVTNSQNIIVDYNKATANILGKPETNLFGNSLQSIFTEFPNLVEILHKNHEVEMEKTLRINDDYRYLNIRVFRLLDNKDVLAGRLILWRDITNRRRAEDARQQARNEMFVLLNALANSASQTNSLSEFLSDAIYQIVHPFRSQYIYIYLYDERSNQDGEEDYYLAAHIGLSTESLQELSKLSASTTLLKWLDENRQYLLLEGPQDHRFPVQMKALGITNLLAFPLLVHPPGEKKLMGVLFMGRKNNSEYKPDEIVRLTILSDQIATLIDSDRRRKLAIALSERQRLMRDVHDSVSQKLYGLVTLSEAAQAAIEAGSQLDYNQILSRMGENARQAVKELRLFLFQMQPVDLEKEGLISILHHRLAAVEGRADIKARFLADETISLSKRKEIALYYIAQEALNNVLRHAKAKSVKVTLKQGYKFVTLEIADDGCGFDSTNLDRGGLGLKNITERVRQENGKLKILSKPNEGTIIRVSFEKYLKDKSRTGK